jgi:hypothetical protein
LAAPGYKVNISDSPVNYMTASGSSYAAPFVTGTVALMLSVNPCLDNDEIEQILKNSSNNIDVFNPNYVGSLGAGRLNANAAVSMAIATPSNMDVVANVTNGCTEGTGEVTISPSQGQEPYQVNTSNGQSEFFFGDLTSGTYTYQITDAHGCIVTTTATVNNGTPAIENFYTNNVSCNGGTNGSVSLVVNNGNPSYTYNWSNGATTESLTELTAGTYTVEITDANGCITNGSYDITEPTAIDLNPTPTADLGNNDGSIDLNITGGTPGYTFEWSNGAITEDLTDLSAGIYTVFVTDVNGCTAEISTEVLNESNANTSTLQDIALNVYPNPSYGNVKISWKGSGMKLSVIEQSGRVVMNRSIQNYQTIMLTDLEAGMYMVTIKSTNGSTATKQLIVL